MKMADIIKAAIPNADQEICEFILWSRTPYPMGKITAQSVYKAASRFQRANHNGMRLCDFCDRIVEEGRCVCSSCKKAFTPKED